jgi:hypothetical protein
MANLDGSRSHGGKWDVVAGAMLREDTAHSTHIYRFLLHAARAEGIDQHNLPDFLGLEHGGEFALLGQDELGTSVFENALKDQIKRAVAGNDLPGLDTERIILAAARVGQHVFALNVLNNCGRRCVFCGLNPSAFGARRMLLAGHIKPWRDSTPAERLDPQNGLAACPSHDVAFDTGLLTVSTELVIHIARRWQTQSAETISPGSTTDARRFWRLSCSRPVPSLPRANTSTGTARKSSLPERLGPPIGLMQPTPGILLGQHFRQALLQDHADRHMLRKGAQRMLQLPPVVLQLIRRQRVHGMWRLLDSHQEPSPEIDRTNLAT